MTISEEPARSPARNQYRSRISSGTACQSRRWDGGRYGVVGQRRHNAGPTSQTLWRRWAVVSCLSASLCLFCSVSTLPFRYYTHIKRHRDADKARLFTNHADGRTRLRTLDLSRPALLTMSSIFKENKPPKRSSVRIGGFKLILFVLIKYALPIPLPTHQSHYFAKNVT